MAEEHEISFNAKFMKDRHTHYEAYPHIKGIIQSTLTIPGHIITDFKEKYGKPIQDYIVHAKIDFIENKDHVDPDVYRNANHLRGTLHSLDEIIKVEENGI